MIYLIVVMSVILAIVIITIVELKKNNRVKKLPSRPDIAGGDPIQIKVLEANVHALVGKLETGGCLDQADYEAIEAVCVYLDHRYDCSDFRMQSILRLLYKHSDRIKPEAVIRMKRALLDSKYFMDQPGEDSLCLWSENHLLIFAAAEYLTGQLYEDELFTNDGLCGKEHKALAKKRLLIWLEQRFRYGFIEWYSNTYYEEDIAPLANIIEFCDDSEVVEKTKMILDLLLFDMASQSYKGSFTSTSGRQYEAGKKSGTDSALRSVTRKVWGYDCGDKPPALDQCFIHMQGYEVPEVIKVIGRDHKPKVIKASTGLNLDELITEFPDQMSMQRVMMQWAMESFSNPETIASAMKYIHRYKMLSNEFMNGFKLINLSILKHTGLLPLVSRILRPATNGSAIQRANTYTYRTEDYMLATAQNYCPGDFGDQQHIWSATLAKDLCVFTTHPALPMTDDGALSLSPGYWVGNGRNPHAVQHENVNLSMYVIDGKKGFMEGSVEEETHCYFPVESFDAAEVMDNVAFGKRDDGLIAVRSLNSIKRNADELIQQGDVTLWVTELGSLKEESFASFKERVLTNKLEFNRETLTACYSTNGRTYELTYRGDYIVDGSTVDTEYLRFDSPYSITGRKSKKIILQHMGHQLKLDFDKGIRVHS